MKLRALMSAAALCVAPVFFAGEAHAASGGAAASATDPKTETPEARCAKTWSQRECAPLLALLGRLNEGDRSEQVRAEIAALSPEKQTWLTQELAPAATRAQPVAFVASPVARRGGGMLDGIFGLRRSRGGVQPLARPLQSRTEAQGADMYKWLRDLTARSH